MPSHGTYQYMGVLYEDDIEIVAKSGECVQRTLDGKHKPQLVVICKTAMCNYYSWVPSSDFPSK